MREKVITSDRIDALATTFDGYIDFKELVKGIAGIGLELADKTVFKVVLNLANTKLLVKLPEGQDGNINAFCDEIVAEDYDAAADLLGDITAGCIKTPLGDATENEILDAIFMFLAGFINKEGGDVVRIRENISIRKDNVSKKLLKAG